MSLFYLSNQGYTVDAPPAHSVQAPDTGPRPPPLVASYRNQQHVTVVSRSSIRYIPMEEEGHDIHIHVH